MTTFTLPLTSQVSRHMRVQSGYCQLLHRIRYLRQKVNTPQLAIVGGYHYGNLGDMALGYSVQRQTSALKLSSDLQTIYNLAQWPKARAVIVGGGAVAYAGPMEALHKIYGSDPARVAMLGVDFNDPQAIENNLDFLSKVAVITCRSSEQAQMLGKKLGRSDINWHYDLVFSYADDASVTSAFSQKREKIFGINTVPFFLEMRGKEFSPGSAFLAEVQRFHPELLPHVDDLGKRYTQMVKSVVQQARKAGMRVVHIPFEPVDDGFARSAFAGEQVEFLSYTPNMRSVMGAIGRCDRFFTTRYHSLILALISGTPVVPFAYASKGERLLTDLGFSKERFTGAMDLLNDGVDVGRKAFEAAPITVERAVVEQLGSEVTRTIHSTISRITA